MSYLLPKRAIRTAEPLDPALVNENNHPPAWEMSGRLNEHNIKKGTFPVTRVADAAYYAFANGGTPYYAEVASNHGIPLVAPYVPTAADPNVWRLPDSGEWDTVGSMTLTVPTGVSVLWLIALVQYAQVPTATFSTSPYNPGRKPRVQFAFRVDGAIIESVIPGQFDVNNPAPKPYLPDTPVDSKVSIHTFTTAGVGAMMFHVRPVRIQELVPVSQGSHTVEVVARRVPNDFAIPSGVATADTADPVYCYNRKFLAVDLHLQPPSASADDALELGSVSEGGTVNVANVYTGGIADLAAKENALLDGDIMRNGLSNEHLPSRILYPNQIGLSTGQAAFATVYPGYGVQPGWTQIRDGGGAACETTNGPYDFSATPGFVILLGNVHLERIDTAGLQDPRQYGYFTIQQTFQSGAVRMNSASEVVINNPNVNPDAGATVKDNWYCQTDVPLFEFYDYRAAPPADGIVSKWGIFGSSQNLGGAANLGQRASNLALLVFRK